MKHSTLSPVRDKTGRERKEERGHESRRTRQKLGEDLHWSLGGDAESF